MWDVFEISVNLFQVTIIIQTITNYLGSRYTDLKGKILGALAVAILFIELNYINEKVNFEGLAIIVPIFITFIYAVIALRGSWKKKLYCSVLIMIFIIGITTVVMNFMGILFDRTYVDLIEEKNNIRIISLVIIQVLIFYITRIFLHKRSEDVGELSWDMWIITIIIPIVSIMILAFVLEISINTIDEFRDSGIKMAILVSMGIFVTNISTYLMYIKLKKDTAEKIEYELLKQRYNIQERNIEDVKQLYSRLQKTKHDVKHHINLLIILLEKNRTEEALDYLIEYSKSIYSAKRDKIFCNNMIINYIINLKIQVMEEANIRFYCDICENIDGVSEVDLNIILGNLLDNAIEGCEKLKEEREIALSIYRKACYLVVRVENTFLGNIDSLLKFQTTKKNNKEHGFGLLSVKDILEKYKLFFTRA